MEDVVEAGTDRQGQANGDIVDPLCNAVWPEEPGLELAGDRWRQRRRRAMT